MIIPTTSRIFCPVNGSVLNSLSVEAIAGVRLGEVASIFLHDTGNNNAFLCRKYAHSSGSDYFHDNSHLLVCDIDKSSRAWKGLSILSANVIYPVNAIAITPIINEKKVLGALVLLPVKGTFDPYVDLCFLGKVSDAMVSKIV